MTSILASITSILDRFTSDPATMALTGKDRLGALLSQYPYLDLPKHQLHKKVKEARAGIDSGDNVENLLDRIEADNEAEQMCLAEAFKRFDNDPKGEKGKLSLKEMKLMCDYLAFPSTDDDVSELMKAIDADGDGTVSLPEFILYVGKIGGSMQLFEARRARTGASAPKGYVMPVEENLEHSLIEAGISRMEQASWKLVVPFSNFEAVGELAECQKNALKEIRRLAKLNHEKALPVLQRRMADPKFKFKDTDLWMTLAWIRELAPLILHVNLDNMLQWMEKDTHYRNQFETGKSGGLLNLEVRKKWEKDLFGGCYDHAEGKDRVKYGVQNVMNDQRGVVACAQYGRSYVILKDVRLRCTFSPEDSANLKADKLAVLDYYAHVLNEYSDAELRETVKVAGMADAAILGDSSKVSSMKYKELQIHGQVEWARHVERLVAHTSHRSNPAQADRIQAVAKKYGWKFSWMDEERDRMKKEDMHRFGEAAFKDKLLSVEGGGKDADARKDTDAGKDADAGRDADVIPEGYCKKGCGLKVAPGVTGSGRPYSTCCKGCAMGFGHDLQCGRAALTGGSGYPAGTCNRGCGRSRAPGIFARTGKPYDTCCRGCSTGSGTHDPDCDKRASAEGVR
jgi:hypothetical protein